MEDVYVKILKQHIRKEYLDEILSYTNYLRNLLKQLEYIFDRYVKGSEEYSNNSDEYWKIVKPLQGSIVFVEGKLKENIEKGEQLHVGVEVDIKSFYLFSRNYIERVKEYIYHLFGEKSKDESFQAYLQRKKINGSESLNNNIEEVLDKTKEFRDDFIEHPKVPIPISQVGITTDKKTKLGGYTKAGKFTETGEIDLILKTLRGVYQEALSLVGSNVEKTQYYKSASD